MTEAGDEALKEDIGEGLFDDSPTPELPLSIADAGADQPLFSDEVAPGDAASADDASDLNDEDAAPARQGIKQVRVYAKNEDDLEVLQLVKGGLTIPEALAVRAARLAPQDSQPQEYAPQMSALELQEARLAQLDRQIQIAGEEGSIMTPELARAILERSDLVADVRQGRLEAEAQQQQQIAEAQEQFREEFTQVTSEVLAMYPAAQDPNSALSRSIDEEVQHIISTPNHPLRTNPDVPMILAVKHARKLGIPPQTGRAPSAPGYGPGAAYQTSYAQGAMSYAPEATLPRPGLAPASGSARTAPPAHRMTAGMVEAELQRNLAYARNDEEAAGYLATSLFGASSHANPFA